MDSLPIRRVSESSGAGGIRTHGGVTLCWLATNCHRPLGDRSSATREFGVVSAPSLHLFSSEVSTHSSLGQDGPRSQPFEPLAGFEPATRGVGHHCSVL